MAFWRFGSGTGLALLRGLSAVLATSLLVEFLDELTDGVSGAAWPLIRQDLGLSYLEIGLLLSAPRMLSILADPWLGLLGDTRWRRALILGGGLAFAVALVLTGLAEAFWVLLLGWLVFYPASGAFVNLMQATLMDHDPSRREQNMARWALAGSLGNVLGPLLVGAAVALGLGWRPVFLGLALLTLAAVAGLWRSRLAVGEGEPGGHEAAPGLGQSLRKALAALRRGAVLRWLGLLEAADLMLDVFRGFVALYFVGVVGTGPAEASLAVAVLTGVGLLGDAALLPLLRRVPGLVWLRSSALAMLGLYPLFLLVPSLAAKLALLGLLGFLNSGWYALLQARLYAALPGQSGSVMALGSVAGLLGGLLPLGLGWLADRFGLEAALWCLLAGPLALLSGLPRREGPSEGSG
ncbi:MFS transporter [Calidithermus chliarophilus]|uniref:MFS transporter n=1 Tax=Calidithermus chliarophilus TaxID=52023 RepID=UPI000401038C|nr:MFS transporter [Calidithermus chliarophilus]